MSPVVVLWSPPRARSTAFFRAMLERGDLLGVHEPLCNLIDHGEADVGQVLVRSAGQLMAALRSAAVTCGAVFVKETTEYRHADAFADPWFRTAVTHTFLIRQPEQIARSFYALRPDMGCADIGLEALHEVYEVARAATRAARAADPVVVDSDDLVTDPAATMAAYCAAVGLPFLPESLQWSAGERPEWHRSARWHVAASRSTGFTAEVGRYGDAIETNPALVEWSAHHRPFYERLRAERLHVPAPG
jgi:hypothetical protein